jgi:ribosome-binding factor A
MQGSRPDRVGEEIRQALSQMLARDVHDPGIGFVTITRVKVSPDLQMARVYYTQLGDDRAKKDTVRALERAIPFLRRQLGSRMRLRRVPEIQFHFDQSVEHQARIEKILLDLEEERQARASTEHDAPSAEHDAPSAEHDAPSTEHPAPGTAGNEEDS